MVLAQRLSKLSGDLAIACAEAAATIDEYDFRLQRFALKARGDGAAELVRKGVRAAGVAAREVWLDSLKAGGRPPKLPLPMILQGDHPESVVILLISWPMASPVGRFLGLSNTPELAWVRCHQGIKSKLSLRPV